MGKNRFRLLSLLLALCLMCTLVSAAFAEGSSEQESTAKGLYQFEILSTTDMHGRATTRDVATQNEVSNNMEHVSAVVQQERAIFGDDLILIDNGDTIQGTLVVQYAINYRAADENPMITILKDLNYDVWTMGNHEFNFTPEQRDAQTHYAMDAGIACLAGNVILKEDGLNVHGEEVAAGESFYDPYMIKTIEFDDGKSVRVGIIGLGNAATHTWDLETNYPGLQFSSLDNPEGLLEFEINKYAKEIRDNDLADIVVVSVHNGLGTDDGISGEENFLLESQVGIAARKVSGVDLIAYGHDHTAHIEQVVNADGKDMWIVDGGGTMVTKSVFTVEFDADGNYAGCTVDSDNIDMAEFDPDNEMGEKMEPWFDEVYAWASQPLGTFDNGWSELSSLYEGKTNTDMVLTQNALVDFVHKGQIWCSWQSYESEGIEGATVSIGSAVFGTNEDGSLSFVPQDGDTVSTLELSKLYRYANNLLCAIDMTGEQLYGWMSAVADMLVVDENGNPALGEDVSIYGVDTFYGVDYTYDLTKPLGERVTSATINGENVLDMDTIRVTLNSYRLSGGYGFLEVTGLDESMCCWTASFNLGSDRAPVPTQLGEYVAAMGTVSPSDPVSHGFDSSWTIVTE